jgi:hypothetical protein
MWRHHLAVWATHPQARPAARTGIILLAIAATAAGVAMLWTAAAAAADVPSCDGSRYTAGAPALPDGWRITFDCSSSTDLVGSANRRRQTITIWPAAHDTHDQVQWTVLHEIGHSWDAAYLHDDARAVWRMYRGFPADAPWSYDYSGEAVDMAAWLAAPGEDWAESFAACRGGTGQSRFDPPSGGACQLMASLLGGAR